MQEDWGLIMRKWSAVPLREGPDGVRCGALRRRAHATDAPAKVQRCTRQLQSFALPHGATFALTPSATFALRGAQPLHCRECHLCASPCSAFALSRAHLCRLATPLGLARCVIRPCRGMAGPCKMPQGIPSGRKSPPFPPFRRFGSSMLICSARGRLASLFLKWG